MPDDTSNFAGDPNAPHGPASYGSAPCGPASYGSAPWGPVPYGSAPWGPASYGPGQVEKTHRFLRFLYLSQVPFVILVPLALASLPGGIGSKGGVFEYIMSVLAPIMVFFQALIWIATYIRADAAGVRIVSKAVASLLCLYYASALLCGLAAPDIRAAPEGGIGDFEPSILERLGVDGRFSSRLAILSFLAGAAFLLVTAVVAMASNPLPKELRFQRRKPQWQEGPQMRQEEL